MKINETNRIGSINPYQKQQAARTSETGRKKQTDEVQFSAAAQELLSNSQQVDEAARAGRIEDLKQAVSTGTYHVDTDKIAEKLLPYIINP